jgi:hypothetical protein
VEPFGHGWLNVDYVHAVGIHGSPHRSDLGVQVYRQLFFLPCGQAVEESADPGVEIDDLRTDATISIDG